MKGLKISKADEALFLKILEFLRDNNRIAAMIVAAELSSSMVLNNNPSLDPKGETFQEVAERFADSVYNDAKRQLGMDSGLKAKTPSAPKTPRRSVQ